VDTKTFLYRMDSQKGHSSRTQAAAAASALMMSAAFSATATTAATGCPLIWFGKTDASTTRRPLTPNTRRRGSTTPVSGEAPMRAVDV